MTKISNILKLPYLFNLFIDFNLKYKNNCVEGDKMINHENIEFIKIDFISLNEKVLGKELKETIESKNPYTDLKDIQALFSFLSYIDATQNQKNIFLGKIENKPLNFKLEFKNKNNEEINNYFFENINLGEGNFTHGINHLLSYGLVKERDNLLKKN